VAFASSEPAAPDALTPSDISGPGRSASSASPSHWTWAHLMRRAFDVDVLACPRCGGRLRLIATIDNPRVIREILAFLTISTEGSDRAPPHLPAVHTGDSVGAVPA
jgi:hypothetical protein